MVAYYFAKGGNAVTAVYHDQSEVTDRSVYGTGVYVIVDLVNPFPTYDTNLPGYDYPTITARMQSDSTKNECNYRITQKVNTAAQMNMNAYVGDLAAAAANGTAMTPAQVADCQMATAINNWIGRPNGMLAASDTLIRNNDQQWYLDGKWPVWDPTTAGWSTFVQRFAP